MMICTFRYFYHLSVNCKTLEKKWLPLKQDFTVCKNKERDKKQHNKITANHQNTYRTHHKWLEQKWINGTHETVNLNSKANFKATK